MKHWTEATARELVARAWKSGQAMDLEGIGYGRIHWGNFKDIRSTPSPYYYFLAGLVKELGIRRVLEIGTHSGGSALAMQKGFEGESGMIVTIDITRASDRILREQKNIVKVRGDANKPKVIDKVLTALDGQPVDLMFIDGDHKFHPALVNYSVYSTLLRPKVICLDDITLNAEMLRLWRFLSQDSADQRAVNAAEIIPDIRPGRPGFGLILSAP